MKARVVAPAILSAILLSGCAGPAVETPTPQAVKEPANTQACVDFGKVTVDLADVMVNPPADDNMLEATDGMYERFDGAFLAADGEVAKRIQTLMDNLPEKGIFMLWLDAGTYPDDVKSVVRACEAEGIELDAVVWK